MDQEAQTGPAGSEIYAPTALRNSLSDHLGPRGLRPVRAVQRILAVDVGGARPLQLPRGAAGLRVERTCFLASARVVEIVDSVYCCDVHDIVDALGPSVETVGGAA
ncbi:hypothetical protein U879_02345 [Defluviimonas sp. 20V17]|uniref:GntR family transcriptional regulator n=1 Tax=Allgaiera indica TaxID=765699 RepID=A0AAN4UTX9_9RHOB|nr:UTRA domain-containing protein [Allgaiera indica]KDB05273.1 hypothetical protein U879_02345 [Defluviimonas sp. 20V17]GHE04906.1 hypothetical protein GCM10008024_33840 [Allgaiera indica]SDX59359.1 GntR family transcriptional regulator [Allgaiera indica]